MTLRQDILKEGVPSLLGTGEQPEVMLAITCQAIQFEYNLNSHTTKPS